MEKLTMPTQENTSDRTVADVMIAIDEIAHPDHPLSEALERMKNRGISLLPVSDGDEIIGVLRLQDVESAPDPAASVRGEMLVEIVYCFADDPVEKALRVMETTGHDEYLVVDEEKRLLGHVTRSALNGESLPDGRSSQRSGSDELAARRHTGGGLKRGDAPHQVWNFSERPVIRD